MFQKVIVIAAISVFWAGGIFEPVVYGEDSLRMTAHEHDKSEAAGKSAAPEQMNEEKNVGNEGCPVSGEKIDEKTKVTYEYKGTIYNFCSEDCVEEFKQDPEKYIEKMKKAETGGKDQLRHDQHEMDE